MPVLLAQHTKRLRFGHSGILAPFRINHPVRVAERAAFADVVSGGRLELGLARSGGTEWDTFGVDPETSRAELRERSRDPRMDRDRFSGGVTCW
jgi:alkanesulfonate monooxygenase SsuD/methylene tetrahydromethanopterin reductase-like flavin-dependent oxidoreductase (luciferase family)